MWRSNYAEVTVNYTDSDVLRDLGGLWKQIEPLYRELHAYIRRKLITQYPKEKIKADGPLPAHLLGMTEMQILVQSTVVRLSKDHSWKWLIVTDYWSSGFGEVVARVLKWSKRTPTFKTEPNKTSSTPRTE